MTFKRYYFLYKKQASLSLNREGNSAVSPTRILGLLKQITFYWFSSELL